MGQDKDKQHLKQRLKLSEKKLKSVVKGARSLALKEDLIGKELLSRDIYKNQLNLKQVYSPIGVLLIIFEARPECLPQIVSLAIRDVESSLKAVAKQRLQTQPCTALYQRHNKATNGLLWSTDPSIAKSRTSQRLLGMNMQSAILILLYLVDQMLVRYIQSSTKLLYLDMLQVFATHLLIKLSTWIAPLKLVVDAKRTIRRRVTH